MEEMMEITLPIRKSSLEAFKKACTTKELLTQMTFTLGEAVSDVVEAVASHGNADNEEAPERSPEGSTAFVLSTTAQQMLNSYACLIGSTAEETAFQVSEVLSEELEKVLKGKIADKLGLGTIPRAVTVSSIKSAKKRPPAPTYQDTTGISDGLGDEDLEPVEIPAEEDPSAFVPKKGGLTDEMIENDMQLNDPEHEAASEAVPMMPDQAEFTFANVIMGEQEIDHRISKRKKGPSKSKGKATVLTEEPGE